MRQIQISKRQRPARWQREPLPPDARDPDIARAKQLARRARRPQRQPLHTQAAAWPGRPSAVSSQSFMVGACEVRRSCQ
jgi:hypothetical protein